MSTQNCHSRTSMKVRVSLVVAGLISLPACESRYDLIISDVRIIDGAGGVIEQGALVIDDGRIVSVVNGQTDARADFEIDGAGRSALPGLIDTHWHVFGDVLPAGDEATLDQYIETGVDELLEGRLAQGVTTLMSAGDYFPHVLELRRRLSDGEKRGPRLVSVGRQITGPNDWASVLCEGNAECELKYTAQVNSGDEARAIVRELAAADVDALKLVYDDLIVPGVRIEDEVVAALTDEASQFGLTVFAHVSTREALGPRVLGLGVRGLVHPALSFSPDSSLGADLRRQQIPVSTTVSGSSREWRELTGQDYDEAFYQQAIGAIEYLRGAGVTLAFGTDSVSDSNADERFRIEVDVLNRVLSNAEVISALTKNAADYIGLGDEIGTLEIGKLADIVLVNGDPLSNISDLGEVSLVLQNGQVVVD